MAQRRRFSMEYKRDAVAMIEFPGVSVSQIAEELGLGRRSWGAGVGSRTRRFGVKADHVMRSWASCVESWPE